MPRRLKPLCNLQTWNLYCTDFDHWETYCSLRTKIKLAVKLRDLNWTYSLKTWVPQSWTGRIPNKAQHDFFFLFSFYTRRRRPGPGTYLSSTRFSFLFYPHRKRKNKEEKKLWLLRRCSDPPAARSGGGSLGASSPAPATGFGSGGDNLAMNRRSRRARGGAISAPIAAEVPTTIRYKSLPLPPLGTLIPYGLCSFFPRTSQKDCTSIY